MKFTDQEIDSIALAIYNAAREAAAQPKVESLGAVHQPLPWRMAARAALEAREALFETVGEMWFIDGARGGWARNTREEMRQLVQEKRGAGVDVRVRHVTTKRRKARVLG